MAIPQIITSLLDNDLYKITMMQAVFMQYGDLDVEYDFTNRGKTPFPPGFAHELRRQVRLMGNIRMTDDEYGWLRTCPSLRFMKRQFIDALRGYNFNPTEILIHQQGGELKVKVQGPWYRAILWEVPLLAIISELYFLLTEQTADEKYSQSSLKEKAQKLTEAGCKFIDFGTRRRFSKAVQERVVLYLDTMHPQNFMGASNMFFAMNYDLRPIGTNAHEWYMAHQAMFGSRLANAMASEAWLREFGGQLGTALTDTFTTPIFLRDLNLLLTRQFDGLRQDSGNPFEIGELFIKHWESMGIDPKTKLIVFGDALTTEPAIALQKAFGNRARVSFGIGTFFSNDVGVQPLNIVIKLSRCLINGRWVDVVKLSDSPGKHHGTSAAIEHTKYELGIQD